MDPLLTAAVAVPHGTPKRFKGLLLTAGSLACGSILWLEWRHEEQVTNVQAQLRATINSTLVHEGLLERLAALEQKEAVDVQNLISHMKQCVCPGGRAFGAFCRHNASVHCDFCNPGYTLSGTVCNVNYGGACPNGQLRSPAERAADNQCDSCNLHYRLSGSTCVFVPPPAPPSPPPCLGVGTNGCNGDGDCCDACCNAGGGGDANICVPPGPGWQCMG